MFDPVFLIAIGIFLVTTSAEWIVDIRRKLHQYKAVDTINNIVLGTLTTATKVFGKGIFYAFFAWFGQYAIFDIGYRWWSWIILFFLNDLIFYWFHRWSHEKRLLWLTHVVHHNSRFFNITTSVRGNFLIMTYRFLFWIPIALLGFEPGTIILMDAIAFFYQLFIHTETMKSWGVLEHFMNTPSHHRVHHGSNPAYIDKNYGAVLIIWDKLFGTYRQEDEKVIYGLTKNIGSDNIFHVAFHEFVSLARDLAAAKNLREVYHLVLDYPGWKYDHHYRTVVHG
jgi:sterol desaturase/sphingolipid hydroxylase (fatty acid hydroxylase superfamily)